MKVKIGAAKTYTLILDGRRESADAVWRSIIVHCD